MKNGRYEEDNGKVIRWYKDGVIHRDNGPAVEIIVLDEHKDPIGTKIHYYKEGKLHREDGPAVISSRGHEVWYKDGVIHRDDGPAIKDISYDCNVYLGLSKKETLQWFIDGKIQRDNGPAAEIIYYGPGNTIKDKGVEWYKNGQLHRDNAPAIEYTSGYKEWWQNGLKHRHDGPAIEAPLGENAYFLQGKNYNEREYIRENALSQGKEAPFDLILSIREKFFPQKESKKTLNQ